MRAHFLRLRQGFTWPLWAGFLWSASSIAGNAMRIGNVMGKAWDFIQTPRGEIVLLLVCVISLILVVTWPDVKVWLFKIFGHVPTHRQSINERLESVEARIPTLATEAALLVHMDAHQRLEEQHGKLDDNFAARIGKLEERGIAVVAECSALDLKLATFQNKMEGQVNQLTGRDTDLESRLDQQRMWLTSLQADLRDYKEAVSLTFDKFRPLITPAPAPDCVGLIYRRKWNNENMWVADVTNMMNTTLSSTAARIRFIRPDREITRPNSSWIVDEYRTVGGDLTHAKQADSVTLAMGEHCPFEFVLSNPDGSGSYCATRTDDLTNGDWEARISLISGGDIVEGNIKFRIFPDNDLEWESRTFVLRRKTQG